MEGRKEQIIAVSIDLFSEYGIMNVSTAMIAKAVNVARGDIHYHFKNGKAEILRHILIKFDEIIQSATQNLMEWNIAEADGETALNNLFFRFEEENQELCRKVNRILFCDQIYSDDVKRYMNEVVLEGREARIRQFFDNLVQQEIVKPFSTKTAAHLLNSSFLIVAKKDAYAYPFDNQAMPNTIVNLQDNCKFIINQIITGHFPEP